MLLTEILDEVPDPRGYNAVHDLTDVLFVALAAVLCGAERCTARRWRSSRRRGWSCCASSSRLSGGCPAMTPSAGAGGAGPAGLPDGLPAVHGGVWRSGAGDTRSQAAVDGKSLRRAYDKGRAHMPPLVVTAFDCDTFMSLSQVVSQTGPKALEGLVAVARVESWRTLEGETTHKVRNYAHSRRMIPAEVLRTVRRHWAIENNLHWQLDVLMTEDQTRNRRNNGPANLAALRRLALNVLRSDPDNIPLSHKRLKARWANEDLLKLITHMR